MTDISFNIDDISAFPSLPEPVFVPERTLEAMIGNKRSKGSKGSKKPIFECMLCAHLSKGMGLFETDHSLDDCHRCPDCHGWDAERTSEQHSKFCLAYKQKGVSRKPAPFGLPEVELCKFWKNGQCKFGLKCRYRHSEFSTARSAREESGNITCHECGVFGHHQRDCIAPCEKCDSEDHRTSKCIKCYGCQKWGHAKRECTLCGNCRDNHTTRECPYMK